MVHLWNRWSFQDPRNPQKLTRHQADDLRKTICNIIGLWHVFEVRPLTYQETNNQVFNVWNVEANRWTDWNQQDANDPQDMTKEKAEEVCLHLNQVNGGTGYEVRPLDRKSERSIVSTIPAPAINDTVCKTCHNEKCGSNEKLCWKCGNPL